MRTFSHELKNKLESALVSAIIETVLSQDTTMVLLDAHGNVAAFFKETFGEFSPVDQGNDEIDKDSALWKYTYSPESSDFNGANIPTDEFLKKNLTCEEYSSILNIKENNKLNSLWEAVKATMREDCVDDLLTDYKIDYAYKYDFSEAVNSAKEWWEHLEEEGNERNYDC